jgi:hypothetical protein
MQREVALWGDQSEYQAKMGADIDCIGNIFRIEYVERSCQG